MTTASEASPAVKPPATRPPRGHSWGGLIYRRRWPVIAVSVVIAIASLLMVLHGGTLSNVNTFDFESAHGFNLIGKQFPGTSYDVVLTSTRWSATDSSTRQQFADATAAVVAPLRHDSTVKSITSPFDLPADAAHQFISFDGHSVDVVVAVNQDFPTARSHYPAFRAELRSSDLAIHVSGEPAVAADFDHYSETDLQRAESASLIAAAVLLLLVFGSVVAALVCVAIGFIAVMAGLAGVDLLSHVTDVSQYALNIVSLVGLGVAIDYSLFIASRFREELRRGADTEAALRVTTATAGRAILFSGTTVVLGLCGLLFYHGIFLVSLGLAGAVVVAISVLAAQTLLPAVMAVLGSNINRLSIPYVSRHTEGHGAWHRFAMWVMRRPVLILVVVIGFLLLAGSPFPSLHMVESDVQQLPAAAESRQAYDMLTKDFPGRGASQFLVVLEFHNGSPFTADNVAAAKDVADRMSRVQGVSGVDSYVTAIPAATTATYQQLYASSPSTWPGDITEMVHQSVGRSIAILTATSSLDSQSDAANNLVATLRANDGAPGVTAYVTGNTAFNKDFVNFMLDRTPEAIAFVVLATIVILFILLRSVVLPLKAVVMNLLSLSAAFGAMVWTVQQGHLSSVLGLTPSPIDPVLPMLMFCLVFGLSMDYEVFLLTRMQEAYIAHADNRAAVAEGLEASGRIVTGAAAIMVAVFACFTLLSQEIVIKAIGLGMAVAVLVDATLVRALVVPALMRLLGRANWWAPRWARRRKEWIPH